MIWPGNIVPHTRIALFFTAKQAFDLGKQLNLTIGLAEPFNFIGVAYNNKGDRLKSYEYYDRP